MTCMFDKKDDGLSVQFALKVERHVSGTTGILNKIEASIGLYGGLFAGLIFLGHF